MDHTGKFFTRREALIKEYDDEITTKGQYIVSTKPLHSTLALAFEVVNVDPDNALAFAVCRKGTTLDFFSYGIGEQLPLPQPLATSRGKATQADTNISKSKQTNGASDFVIEALSISAGPFRYEDLDETGGEGNPLVPFPTEIPSGQSLDKDVAAAISGVNAIVDPASIVMPPQVYSPFNLENVFFEGVQPRCSLQLTWDEDRVEKLGTLRNLAQGGGGSGIRSNGHPLCSNVFRVEEGYLWARTSETNSELVVRLQVEEAIVFPITLNDAPDSDSTVIAPAWLYMDLQLKLHGFEFKYPSRN